MIKQFCDICGLENTGIVHRYKSVVYKEDGTVKIQSLEECHSKCVDALIANMAEFIKNKSTVVRYSEGTSGVTKPKVSGAMTAEEEENASVQTFNYHAVGRWNPKDT